MIMSYIEIKDLKKTFRSKGKENDVLKGIDLEVREGEIFLNPFSFFWLV